MERNCSHKSTQLFQVSFYRENLNLEFIFLFGDKLCEDVSYYTIGNQEG